MAESQGRKGYRDPRKRGKVIKLTECCRYPNVVEAVVSGKKVWQCQSCRKVQGGGAK